MLQKSIYTTDIERLDLFLEFENGSTPACLVSINNEILATSDACSSQ